MKKLQIQDSSTIEITALLGAGHIGINLAGVKRRLGAFIVDLIVSSPLVFISVIATLRSFAQVQTIRGDFAVHDRISMLFASSPGPFIAAWIAAITTFILLNYLLSISLGRTLGMALFGLGYTAGKGSQPSPLRFFIRSIVGLVTGVLFFSCWLWVFFDEASRPLHDRISGIYIVRDL